MKQVTLFTDIEVKKYSFSQKIKDTNGHLLFRMKDNIVYSQKNNTRIAKIKDNTIWNVNSAKIGYYKDGIIYNYQSRKLYTFKDNILYKSGTFVIKIKDNKIINSNGTIVAKCEDFPIVDLILLFAFTRCF